MNKKQTIYCTIFLTINLIFMFLALVYTKDRFFNTLGNIFIFAVIIFAVYIIFKTIQAIKKKESLIPLTYDMIGPLIAIIGPAIFGYKSNTGFSFSTAVLITISYCILYFIIITKLRTISNKSRTK